jgi:hypothetical protein
MSFFEIFGSESWLHRCAALNRGDDLTLLALFQLRKVLEGEMRGCCKKYLDRCAKCIWGINTIMSLPLRVGASLVASAKINLPTAAACSNNALLLVG